MKVCVELWLVELFCGIVLRRGAADFGLFTGCRRMLDWFVQWKGCLEIFFRAWTKKLSNW
jgi:hypothetical protein